MNGHIFVVWPDGPGHDPVQEGIAKTGRVGCCQSQVDAGGSEVDHDGQGVSRQGPRRSMGGPAGSQKVNKEV